MSFLRERLILPLDCLVLSLTKIYVIYLWKYCWIIFIILQLLLVEIITIRLFSIHAWAMRC